NVQECDARSTPPGQVKRCGAVAGFADDFYLLLVAEQRTQPDPKNLVIVGDEKPDGHGPVTS
ncbi:MAG: hypothetical protein AAF961_05420, partial [Planctomycetota bacterium]